MPNIRQILAASMIGLWAGCSDAPVAGGSGSEAGNALQVAAIAPDGSPAVGARIEVRLSDSRSTEVAYADTIGPDGTAALRVPPGSWSILVKKAGFAFWAPFDGQGAIRDTLRATSILTGIVDGGSGGTVAVRGLGNVVRCDENGFFQLEDLPSGRLPLAISNLDTTAFSQVRLDAGVRALTLPKVEAIPLELGSLPADTLIPWSIRHLPATLPSQALGDTGDFTVAIRFRRLDPHTPVWAISWTESESRGIRIGWRGADTFVMSLDGKTYRIAGIPLSTDIEQVGLSWDGRRIAVLLGQDSVLSLTSESLVQRSSWSPPEFASTGAASLDWIAIQRGSLEVDWLRRLSRM